MPFPNYAGSHKRFWTRERVLSALAQAMTEIKGPLPCEDARWSAIKKGRLDWPAATRILSYYHSMPRAWLAAGADTQRVSFSNQDWTVDDEEYLLTHAGNSTLKEIADKLRRSYGACRRRLHEHHVKARWNQGAMSAGELAREYNCPYHRVREAIAAGRIKGSFDPIRNRWQVETEDLTAAALAILTAPKGTYTTRPPDVGDYYRRYGLKRSMVNGRVAVVKV